jgi:acetylornithine deacetylase/succinyl-diaminopimelate desuccinylase-like protein
MWKQYSYFVWCLLLSVEVCGAQTAPSSPTAELLQQLIRINTSNPPGNEIQLDEFLAAKLKPLGFETEIIPTPEAGKAHFIARLKGDGSRKAILLAAHADVVGVERSEWSMDPFAGIVKDGYVYGRGALDDKGSLAVFAEAMIRLAKNKIPLNRDIILLSEADEESGQYNTEWLAEHYFGKIDCAASLNEGGWTMENPDGDVQYTSISVADKLSVWLELTAHGTSTHSSMPVADDAIFTLAQALSRLSNYGTKLQFTPGTRQFILTLAKTSTSPQSKIFYDLLQRSDAAKQAAANTSISQNPLLHAILHNTIAPVFLSAGFRGNVIPATAEAKINMRLIPGSRIDDVIQEIQSVVHDARVTIALSDGARPTGIRATDAETEKLRSHIQTLTEMAPSSTDTDLYKALALQAGAAFHAPVTPYLFQAGTDAAAWRSRGIPVYGIYPYPVSPDDMKRMHGNDERLSVHSLDQGTEVIYKTLLQLVTK